ncbi:hypothetical protein F4680DRAFT_346898 [Xylaria scruposa]|nr:hypothetical protein F4680DRAFT_346898 [Xylaria scruposa]
MPYESYVVIGYCRVGCAACAIYLLLGTYLPGSRPLLSPSICRHSPPHRIPLAKPSTVSGLIQYRRRAYHAFVDYLLPTTPYLIFAVSPLLRRKPVSHAKRKLKTCHRALPALSNSIREACMRPWPRPTLAYSLLHSTLARRSAGLPYGGHTIPGHTFKPIAVVTLCAIGLFVYQVSREVSEIS